MKDFKPTVDFPVPDLEMILKVCLGRLYGAKGRAALSMFALDPQLATLEYLHVGDLKLLHFTKKQASSEKDDKLEQLNNERGVSHAKVAKETAKKHLSLANMRQQTFFNNIHSEFLGQNGIKPQAAKRGVFGTIPGDYIVLLNRGVADSLYEKEIGEIIQKFDDLPIGPPQLDAVANVIVEKAFKKIIEFAVDRPFVDRLKKMDVNMQTISVDECHCLVFQVEEADKK